MAQFGDSAPTAIGAEPWSDERLADRAQWELAIEAAGVGGFDWDLVTGRLRWDDRLVELFGYVRDSFDESIDAFNARLHPDDLARVTAALQDAITTCGDFETEYRVVLPHGNTRWVHARGRALCAEDGTPVRLLGAAYDTTAVREGEARVTRILESMSAAFFLLDREWRFTYVNAQAERFLGFGRGELLGGSIWELFPAAVNSDFERSYRQAMQSGEPVTFEAYYPAPLDSWYEVRALPGPEGLSVYFLDITPRRAAEEQARKTEARAALLSQVMVELGGTLNAEEAVGRLARLVVPAIADWCIITLLDDDLPGPRWQRLRDVGWWHRDPDKRALVERYAAVRLQALTPESFLVQALQSGRPAVVRADDASAAIAAVLEPGEPRDLLLQLRPGAAAAVPLRERGRTLGVLSIYHDASSATNAPDVQAAVEVAERAGLALENARLYEEQRRLAARLQRSMLTAPPEPDHMQIVVRYEPAVEAAQVGGDWYDAFLQRQGDTMIVIGDVVGHDAAAAAAMGQIRGLLRGIAATTGEGPAAVLSRLDEAMDLLQIETTATAVVARIEQTADERERGVTRVRWSNAGHPPPMIISSDGSVALLADLAGFDADLLLGIEPGAARSETEIVLDRDATVLLYTDGLVERRGQSVDEGMRLLRDVLVELADLTLDELCDRVLERMLPAEPEDDVAMVAIRLHRQDRPRPTVAGPQRVPTLVEAKDRDREARDREHRDSDHGS